MTRLGTVLVVGARGRVGAPLVRELLAAGATVRAASDQAPGVAYSSSLSTVRLDIAAPGTWPRALSRVRRMFLALPAPDDHDSLQATRSFLDVIASTGVDHVVFMSSAAVEQGTAHGQVEAHIDEIGLPRTFLRPATLHQELAGTSGDAIATHDRLRLAIAPATRVAYVDARDVARVAATILLEESPATGATYTLTGPEALTGAEVAAVLSRCLGRRITFEPAPLLRAAPAPTVPAQLTSRGTSDPSLRRLLGGAPTSLADYVGQHRSRWATPVG